MHDAVLNEHTVMALRIVPSAPEAEAEAQYQVCLHGEDAACQLTAARDLAYFVHAERPLLQRTTHFHVSVSSVSAFGDLCECASDAAAQRYGERVSLHTVVVKDCRCLWALDRMELPGSGTAGAGACVLAATAAPWAVALSVLLLRFLRGRCQRARAPEAPALRPLVAAQICRMKGGDRPARRPPPAREATPGSAWTRTAASPCTALAAGEESGASASAGDPVAVDFFFRDSPMR